MYRQSALAAYRSRALTSTLARLSVRASSSSSGPCTKYTDVTHPEDPASLDPAIQRQLHRLESCTANTYARPPLIFTSGRGSHLFTSHPTREYLDFSAGIAVNALGHSDSGFIQVMADQVGSLAHASNVYWNEWVGELASLLVGLTRKEGGLGYAPDDSYTFYQRDSGPHLFSRTYTEPEPEDLPAPSPTGAKVFISNSGTEANEGALKFARKYGKELWARKTGKPWEESTKTRFLCFENAFHGRSMGALSATTNPKYQKPFGPLVPGFDMGKLNDMSSVKFITEDHCGVILEPIQGEGGIFECDIAWLKAIRKRCDEVGAVLIYDEIQCGLYRTGTMWAHSRYPTTAHPNVITMAKALGNGYPIGAILVKDEIAKAVTVGSHGTTFGGNVLAARLAHYVLTRLSTPSFLEHLALVTTTLDTRLSSLAGYFPSVVSSVRGRGAIRGVGFHKPEDAAKLVKMARERGVLFLSAGKDAVRFVPSLNIALKDVEHAMDVLESCLAVMSS
ncbi:PLP-dependent transferase [Dacryopinax primogenitus]|uniref:PLP-dependent transferase n=1 Tax=Dacryopinax primogenitus (strain DJM 731) TaxID=1858805 RepID=M5FRP2_DACPD|nr:PLP-dependent transferase [Dacryopinax primogenitus]EJT97674.1 PLP-dependent transferase [Dacryopinax primogenitus]